MQVRWNGAPHVKKSGGLAQQLLSYWPNGRGLFYDVPSGGRLGLTWSMDGQPDKRAGRAP